MRERAARGQGAQTPARADALLDLCEPRQLLSSLISLNQTPDLFSSWLQRLRRPCSVLAPVPSFASSWVLDVEGVSGAQKSRCGCNSWQTSCPVLILVDTILNSC